MLYDSLTFLFFVKLGWNICTSSVPKGTRSHCWSVSHCDQTASYSCSILFSPIPVCSHNHLTPCRTPIKRLIYKSCFLLITTLVHTSFILLMLSYIHTLTVLITPISVLILILMLVLSSRSNLKITECRQRKMENHEKQQGEREVTKRKSKESIYQVTYNMAYLGKTPPVPLVKLKGISLTLSAGSQSACKVQNGS